MSFDRYSQFRSNGTIGIVPFIPIQKKATDKHITYSEGKTKLDVVSYEYYGSPDYAWLILQANPQYGSIEQLIPDGSYLRIPYPLDETLNLYTYDIDNYKKLY